MQRLIAPLVTLSTVLFLGVSANAQHGKPPGTPGGPGSMGGSSTTHGNSGSAGGAHGSNAMSSTNPGSVLEHNSNLAGKLETLTGTTNVTDLEKDASAFKNFGQFVAAAHVAKNLNIPGGFSALMCDVTAKTAVGATSACTNTTKMSLGKAIQTLDPQADSKAESKKATQQAKQDLNESNS
jgi:hypothetical protein